MTVYTRVVLRILCDGHRLYASLRRLQDVPLVVERQLARFDLTAVQDTYARQLSSTSQRLLSLAVSTIGAPRVIILDAPTAGVRASFLLCAVPCLP